MKDETKAKLNLSIIGIAIAGFILILAIYSLGNGNGNSQSVTSENTQVLDEEVSSISLETDKNLKDTFGIEGSYSDFLTSEDYPTGSNIGFISEMENIGSNGVRVFVQADLSEQEAKKLGTTIMSNVGQEITELEWIVVRGTDGLDYNISRDDAPVLR